MPKVTTRPVREAIISALKDEASVAGVLGGRIYGPNPPSDPDWPFARYEVPSSTPFRATCLDGELLAGQLSLFVKSPDDDVISDLTDAVAAFLDEKTLHLEATFPATVRIRVTGKQFIRDSDEATGWHGIVQFLGTVVS